MRRINFYLIFVQVLGLFPTKGLWFSKSVMDYTFKLLSFQFLYTLFTLWVRLAIMGLEVLLLVWWATNRITSRTDLVTACVGFTYTFFSGAIFQILTLCKVGKFIIFLQKILDFDSLYPTKNKIKWCTPFLKQNLFFSLLTIVFSVSMITSDLFESSTDSNLKEISKNVKMEYKDPITLTLICSLVLLFMESATVFPIFQLAYGVKSIELRLQETLDLIIEQSEPKPKTEYEQLLDIYTNGKWAEKKMFAKKISFLKDEMEDTGIQPSHFWKWICQKHLDFLELFQHFQNFSGAYFVIIYPIQIFSSICIIFINTSTDVLDHAPVVKGSLLALTSLGLVRIYSMSNIGHRFADIQSKLLMRTLRIDANTILDDDEQYYFEKFVTVLKTVPMELSAMGIFNIGRRNIPAIISALVTYIIVLFQFKSTEKSSSPEPSTSNITSYE